MEVKKVLRTFTFGFELFELDFKGNNNYLSLFNLLLKRLKLNSLSDKNEVMYENNKNCKGYNGNDVFTFSRLARQEDNISWLHLYRIASRKHNVLSEKGRNGFIHIGLESIIELPVFFVVNKEHINVRLDITPTLHIDVDNFYKTDENSNNVINKDLKLRNMATASFVMELHDNRYEEFFSTIGTSEIYTNLSDKFSTEIAEKTRQMIEKSVDKIRRSNFYSDERAEENPNYNAINLRTFLFWYIWASFLCEFRKDIYGTNPLAKIKKRYTEGCRFVNAIDDLKRYLSFESKTILLETLNNKKRELAYNRSIFSSKNEEIYLREEEEWLDFISQAFNRNREENFGWEYFRSNIADLVKRDLEGAFYFRNMRLYFSYDANYEPEVISGSSLRWDVTWAIILGDILCTLSQTFISYNSQLENYLWAGKKTKLLIKLLRKASLDFKIFYDADMLQNLELRDALEKAKETFLINSYHEKLVDRLKLFSDYEIEENESKSNSLIFGGGIIAYIVISASLDVSIVGFKLGHLLLLSAIILETLSFIGLILYYFFKNKLS